MIKFASTIRESLVSQFCSTRLLKATPFFHSLAVLCGIILQLFVFFPILAPGFTVDLQTEFTLFNDTIGSYVITWTPPSLDNGSYYQILYYSFSSAYTIGPLYNGSSSIMLDQGQGSYNVPNALYYTNYTITITTVNIKYNISNGPVEIMDQTPSAGIFVQNTFNCQYLFSNIVETDTLWDQTYFTAIYKEFVQKNHKGLEETSEVVLIERLNVRCPLH